MLRRSLSAGLAVVVSSWSAALLVGCFSSDQSPPPSDAGRDVTVSDAPAEATPEETGSEAGASDGGHEAAVADAGLDSAAAEAGPDAALESGPAPGTPLWFRTSLYAGDGGAFSSADFVAADTAGNVYASVRFQGTVDFGAGPVVASGGASSGDLMIVKYDPSGAFVWSTHLPVNGTGNLQTEGMAVDAQGEVGLVLDNYGTSADFGSGAQSGRMFAVKLDSAGHVAWSKSYAAQFFLGDTTGYYNTQDVAMSSAGDLAFGGYLYQSVDLGGGTITPTGSTDAFVVALDPGGNFRFARHWGVAGKNAQFNGVAFAPGGDLALVGNVDAVAFDFGGGSLPAIGVADTYGNADGVLLVLDTSGAYVSARRFGGSGASTTANMVVSSGTGFALGGTFKGTGALDWGGGAQLVVPSPAGVRLYAAKLDGAGTEVWSQVYGDPTGWLQFGGIAASSTGGPVVAGLFDKGIDFGDHAITSPADAAAPYKAFIAELAAGDGGPVFSRASNASSMATGSAYGWGAAAGGDGVFVAGRFSGTVDFGGGPQLQPNAGIGTYFVAKFAQ